MPQSAQSISSVWLFVAPWTAAHQTSLSITNSWSLLKLISIESVMPSNHLILCHLLLLPPSIFPSISVFSMSQFFASDDQSVGASASVLPINIQDWSLGWTGWISLQSKGLSSLLQHHSSKASILQCSAFFMVQLSHPYMTTGNAMGNKKKCLYREIHNVVKLTNSHLFQVWKVFDIRDLKGKICVLILGLSENSNECKYFI